MNNSSPEMVARRSELMAELFLQDLGASFIARFSQDTGIDFFLGFKNSDGGLNVVAVEVKATAQPVKGRFRLPRKQRDLLANSNLPSLLLVVDVKLNRYYYAELSPGIGDNRITGVYIPLIEVNDKTRAALIARLSGPLNKRLPSESEGRTIPPSP